MKTMTTWTAGQERGEARQGSYPAACQKQRLEQKYIFTACCVVWSEGIVEAMSPS